MLCPLKREMKTYGQIINRLAMSIGLAGAPDTIGCVICHQPLFKLKNLLYRTTPPGIFPTNCQKFVNNFRKIIFVTKPLLVHPISSHAISSNFAKHNLITINHKDWKCDTIRGQWRRPFWRNIHNPFFLPILQSKHLLYYCPSLGKNRYSHSCRQG